jgi:hypothetical protein
VTLFDPRLENDLKDCGVEYALRLQLNSEKRFEEIGNKIDGKFESLAKLFERNEEICETKINGKLTGL